MQAAWDVDSDIIPRIATPFGGGFARAGLTCGAVMGAVMAIGIRLGRSNGEEDKEPSYAATQKFMSEFAERFGATSCRDLTGLDLSTEQGRQAWDDQGWQGKCAEFVEWAVRETDRVIQNAEAGTDT